MNLSRPLYILENVGSCNSLINHEGVYLSSYRATLLAAHHAHVKIAKAEEVCRFICR
jgi:hypothetical protein